MRPSRLPSSRSSQEAGGQQERDEDLLIPGGVRAAVEVDVSGAVGAGVDPSHGVGLEVAMVLSRSTGGDGGAESVAAELEAWLG